MISRFMSPHMMPHPDGDFIHYSDYAALEAENARLTKERDEWEKSATTLARDFIAHVYARTEASAAVKVKAEIDRLRPHYQSHSALDLGRRQLLDHFDAFRSAISPSAQQEDEVVAWLYDWTDDDGVTHTEASVQSVRTVNFKPVFNVRPLYTHPPAPAVTEAQIEAAARNIASLYGSPDECVQGSGGSGTSGVSFQCQKRAWENYVAHARAALQAIEVKK